jgi:tetratricopeptide (TPR) repeat protein
VADHDPRLADLFASTVALSAEQRVAFLAAHCADAPQLQQRVLHLLRSHDGAGDFLEHPAGMAEPLADAAPDLAGRYRILAKVGAGAMGTVYRAEQLAPVRREVALKVLASQLAGAEAHARFRAEQQAVAILDHPHVARLYDSGTTADGRPYFAMEFVDGEPIQTFCTAHALPRRDRVAQLALVCRAVHYAHQKGLVHRDLKPSNVLIAMQDGRPTPRVIDFGVAKTLAAAPDAPQPTAHGELLGTLEYMSPEQAGATADVDTRADVYSLGVMLYELLAGERPLPSARLRGVPLAEALRIVREEEPPLPSAGAGDPTLRELDWVVHKAMAKDRTRRYGSAAELADDLERWLRHEPLVARPDTAGYRLQKLLRRHRVATVAAVAVAVATLAGVVATLIEAAHAREQRDRAFASERRAALNLRQVVDAMGMANTFLGEVLANIAGATRARRQQAETILRTLEKVAALPDTDGIADWGLGYAWQRLGEVQLAMGEPADALESFGRSLGFRERLCARDGSVEALRPLAVGHWKMSEALTVLGRHAEAAAHDRQALAMHQRQLEQSGARAGDRGAYLGISLRRIADGEREAGRAEVAAQRLDEARAAIEAGLKDTPGNPVLQQNHAMVLIRRAELHVAAGAPAAARDLLALAETSLRAQTERVGPSSIIERRILARCHLAAAVLATAEGRHADALAAARAAGRVLRAIVDADPLLHEVGHQAAEALLHEARALAELGHVGEAQAVVAAAQESLGAQADHSSQDAGVRCDLARACLLAAEMHARLAAGAGAEAGTAARAAAALERARARTLLQGLQAAGRLPPSAEPLLADTGR